MNKPKFSYPVLQHPAPQLTKKQAEQLFSRWIEKAVFLNPLSSERDQNFLFKDKHDKKFVLKVSNTKESFEVLDCQNKGLEHLEANTSLNIPKIISDKNEQKINQVEINNNKHFLRVVSYVEGVPVGDAKEPKSLKALHHNMGVFLGLLGKGFRGFSHKGSNHKLLWDVKETESLFDILEFIENSDKRRLAQKTLEHFSKHIKPKLDQTRVQVIHNDMNPDNLLVEADNPQVVSGIIDFGDMVNTPLVNDLAVAAAYQTIKQKDLFVGTCDLLAGYQDEYPLTETEISLLPGLIVNRIAMTLVISEWRATTHPENKEYILGAIEKTWAVLKQIHKEQPRETANQLIGFLNKSGHKL